jgi:hypothetical protein
MSHAPSVTRHATLKRKSRERPKPIDAAPVEVVRDVPRREREHDRGNEIGETDDPQIERLARERVDLIADRRDLHVKPKRGQRLGDLKKQEVAVVKDGAGPGGGRRDEPEHESTSM